LNIPVANGADGAVQNIANKYWAKASGTYDWSIEAVTTSEN
jgi:hypothetical protein